MIKRIIVDTFQCGTEQRLWLDFEGNTELEAKARFIRGRKYDEGEKKYHIPFTEDYRKVIRRGLWENVEVIERKDAGTGVCEGVKTLYFEKDPGNGLLVVRFHYDVELFGYLSRMNGFLYLKERRVVVIDDEAEQKRLLYAKLKELGYEVKETRLLYKPLKVRKEAVLGEMDKSPLPAAAKEELEKFRLYLEHRRYSSSTVRTYTGMIGSMFRYMKKDFPFRMSKDDVIAYVNGYILKNGFSSSYQNQFVNAARIYFREVLKDVLEIGDIERPRGEKRIPNVLSMKEVRRILESSSNQKHRMALKMIYAFGLRRSELLSLMVNDIDRERGFLIIRQSKGKKDRLIPLSARLMSELDGYLTYYKPKRYLFEGQDGERGYSASSLVEILNRACLAAGIRKHVTLHTLRHCYATHLLENGTDIRLIQELLGHSNLKTTEIYTHISKRSLKNIRSPFDDLDNIPE
jgi:integrase/recombinase XerD